MALSFNVSQMKPPAGPKTPKLSKPDPFERTVGLENKKVGGLTKGLIKPYQEAPSRYLPKARGLRIGASLKSLAAAGKVKI